MDVATTAGTVQLVTGLIAMDQLRLARMRVEAADRRARERGDVTAGLEAAWLRAEIAFHEGRLDEAERDLALVLDVAEDLRAPIEPLALRTRMTVRQARGDLLGAVGAMAVLRPLADREPLLRGHRGWLLLDEGRDAEAARELLAAIASDEDEHGIDDPGIAPWRTGAAIAFARLGDRDRAVALAEAEVARARELGAARPLGRALSALGLALGGEEGLPAHAEAVKTLERSPSRVWLPAALLEQGAALQRVGRRVAARRPLARAGQLAQEMGLNRVAATVEEELRSAGGRSRRPVREGAATMTPSERRVAALAAAGRTTPQIAERLAVSRRTVEACLHSVYRKLDIHARRELPDALGLPVPEADER